jgi:hypothetical protein
MPSSTVIDAKMALHLQCRQAFLSLTDERNGHKPFCQGQVRIVEYRAAGGAKLLPTGQALVDSRALVLASLARNLGHTGNFAAMNAA